MLPVSSIVRATALALAVTFAGHVRATDACDLCDKEIVTNSVLADCFLDEYPALASSDGDIVAVDLSACPLSRGGLEALPTPGLGGADAEPDVEFLLSRAQLDCLKRKLEEPGVILDPSAKIELASCG